MVRSRPSRAHHHDLGPGLDRPLAVAPDRDAVQLAPHAVEHLLGGRGELDLLGDRQATVDGQAGIDDQPVARLEGGQAQDLVEVAGDVGALQAQPEPHPLLRPVRLRLLFLGELDLLGVRVCLAVGGALSLFEASAALVVAVLLGDARVLVLLQIADEERLPGEHPLLRRRQALPLPGRQLDVPLDGDELLQRVGQGAGLLLEDRQVGQIERRLLGLLVAAEVLRHALHRLEAPGVEPGQQVGCRVPIRREVVLPPEWRPREIAPGRIGVLERDLAVEAGAAGVPAPHPRDLRVVRGRLQLGPEVEEPGPEEVAVGRALVPVEPQEGGHGLQRLADHRVVLLVADLAIEKGRDRGVEGRELGHEVVERCRAQDRCRRGGPDRRAAPAARTRRRR